MSWGHHKAVLSADVLGRDGKGTRMVVSWSTKYSLFPPWKDAEMLGKEREVVA